MKTGIIVSTTERKTDRRLAFLMSLLVPGLGEFYAGVPLSGLIFSLSRLIAVLAIPFYSSVNSSEPMTEEIFTAITFFILITIASPVYASFKNRKNKALLSSYNSAVFYSAYTLLNIIFTVFSIAFFLTFFEIKKTDEASPPLFRKGDIIAIKKITPGGYSSGNLVAVKSGTSDTFLRVIGLPGERIEYRKGRFLIDGSELPLAIFTEEELRKLTLTDYDVVAEQNGKTRYAVKGEHAINVPEVILSDKEYYLAPDIRKAADLFLKAEPAIINGRVEGVLFSREAGILPGSTSLPSDISY